LTDKIRAPWKYLACGGYDHYVYSHGTPSNPAERIAVVYYPSGAHSYGEARAALITEAPAMLALLQRWLRGDDLRDVEAATRSLVDTLIAKGATS
jgi:hypothetical protein